MGVPIGYGGQIFDMSALKRIAWLHQLARSRARTLLIEVDGGLTMNNLPLCRQAGAQAFSGWSVVKGGTEELLRRNVRTLLGLLGGPDGRGQP
jgi:pentose-5-phosphate-3-epimerase